MYVYLYTYIYMYEICIVLCVLDSTVTDWDSMGRVITQTRGRAFQTLGRAFSFFSNSQKLG